MFMKIALQIVLVLFILGSMMYVLDNSKLLKERIFYLVVFVMVFVILYLVTMMWGVQI